MRSLSILGQLRDVMSSDYSLICFITPIPVFKKDIKHRAMCTQKNTTWEEPPLFNFARVLSWEMSVIGK